MEKGNLGILETNLMMEVKLMSSTTICLFCINKIWCAEHGSWWFDTILVCEDYRPDMECKYIRKNMEDISRETDGQSETRRS